MIAAVVLLALAGYFAARGLLDEDDVLAAAGLGTALGWCGFITTLNLLLRGGLPFAVATPLALGLLLALGGLGFWRLRRSGARASLDRTDLLLVLACATPASLLILLYQFLGPDSDNFIHYPLVALFLKGHFPHFNPYFPDIPLYGHYGRDLGLAGLLHFGLIGTGTAMAIEAWVLHMATLANVYTLGRRLGGGSRAAGALAAAFAFYAVNAGFEGWVVRSGLAEVMGNNNPVLHAFLFAILLLAERVVRRPAVPAALLLGLLLGGFDHVYETHYHVALLGIGMLAALCLAPRLRPPEWRRAMALLGLAVVFSAIVMLACGGLTARMILARAGALVGAPGSTAGAAAEGDAYAFALAGAQQKVDVTFPKRPFLALTHAADGRPVALLGREFLGGQGLGFWLLPVSTLVLLWRRRIVGLALALMSLASILVPSCIDFGRFNGENFRYIFLSGLLAAVCAGVLLGEAYAAAARSASWGGRRRLAAIAALGVLLYACSGLYRQRESYARTTLSLFPQLFYVSEAERLDQFCAEYSAADARATAFLAAHGRLADRLASNYAAPYQRDSVDLPNNAMTIMSGAWMPMVGFDARIMRQGAGIQTSVSGWSGRAAAFWATADAEILRDLGADWLYVVPRWLPPGIADALARLSALREAFRSEEGGVRVVYRVDRAALGARPAPDREALAGLELASLEGLEGGALERFARLRATLRAPGAPVSGPVYVHYRIRDLTAGADYDPADGVGSVHALRVAPGEPQTIEIPFVFPYNPGEYRLTLYAHSTDGEVSLGESRFTLRPGSR